VPGVRTRLVPIAAVVALITAMRLRFLVTPITSDEGGYLAIARAWRHGAVLYRDVWVDRPQGLLVLYRALDTVGLGTPVGVRLLALFACIVGALACGSIAASLAGERARIPAALLVGVLSSLPQIEGFIANAELLSCAIGATSLAVALRALRGAEPPSWLNLVGAGVLGGVALTVKQSGFDAFGAALVAVLLAAAASTTWPSRRRVLAVPAVLLGAALPLGTAAVHGAVTGWQRWWFAVAGYRIGQRSALANADWQRFRLTRDIAAPALAPIAAAIIVLVLVVLVQQSPARVRHLRHGGALVCVVWTVLAGAAFASGGQFHRHYWVILTFPLGTIAGVVLALAAPRGVRAVATAALAAMPLLMTAQAIAIPRLEAGSRLSGDSRLVDDEAIAAWYRLHAEPGDDILALCASAGLYGNLRTDPPYPYLWHDGIRNIPSAQRALTALLAGDDRPRFVAEYQGARSCVPSGAADRALHRHYRVVVTIGGIPILERT
jgi:4-amino-4-deoxy-L-arabinose transferase-like glycosyltransferase